MGPIQYSVSPGPTQGPNATAGAFRCRRCLLKGCEQFYRPTHPQSRYCGDACRREARRWRRHQASRTWRASEPGKARRREQSRRYRRRIPLVVLPESYFSAEPALPESPPQPITIPVPERREGQRPASKSEDFLFRWCKRPGCYTVFPVRSAFSPKRFCSSGCRRAFRNVLDREARYRHRGRNGDRPRRQRSRPAPSRPP